MAAPQYIAELQECVFWLIDSAAPGRQHQYRMLPESGHTGCDRRAGLDFRLL